MSSWIDEVPTLGDIIRKGRIMEPYKWGGYGPSNFRPYSNLLIALNFNESRMLADQLRLRNDQYIAAWPGCPSLAGLMFERIYVVAELQPEMRTEEEEAWFAKMHPQFTAGFTYVVLN